MPFTLFMLALAILAQGTSELMVAGLLPQLAAGMDVSIPNAGLLISGFAVGMAAGGPTLAVATLRVPRRVSLSVFVAVFVAAHVAGALAPGFGVLLATRVVSAFVYAGLWAVAMSATVAMVPPGVRSRALAIVAGGYTVATVFGLPLGTLIGQLLGWRAAFWAVAAAAAMTGVAAIASLPAQPRVELAGRRWTTELRGLMAPQLWLAYGIIVLSMAGLIGTYSYLVPLLTTVAGVPEVWIPAVLGLYGAGSFIGITLGGHVGDRRPLGLLAIGLSGLVLAAAGIAVFDHGAALAIGLVFLLGGFGLAVNPALNSRPFALAPDAPTLVSGLSVAAFNVGITVGPLLTGLPLRAGLGYPYVAGIGAAMAAAALGAVGLAYAAQRRRPAMWPPTPGVPDGAARGRRAAPPR